MPPSTGSQGTCGLQRLLDTLRYEFLAFLRCGEVDVRLLSTISAIPTYSVGPTVSLRNRQTEPSSNKSWRGSPRCLVGAASGER